MNVRPEAAPLFEVKMTARELEAGTKPTDVTAPRIALREALAAALDWIGAALETTITERKALVIATTEVSGAGGSETNVEVPLKRMVDAVAAMLDRELEICLRTSSCSKFLCTI